MLDIPCQTIFNMNGGYDGPRARDKGKSHVHVHMWRIVDMTRYYMIDLLVEPCSNSTTSGGRGKTCCPRSFCMTPRRSTITEDLICREFLSGRIVFSDLAGRNASVNIE